MLNSASWWIFFELCAFTPAFETWPNFKGPNFVNEMKVVFLKSFVFNLVQTLWYLIQVLSLKSDNLDQRVMERADPTLVFERIFRCETAVAIVPISCLQWDDGLHLRMCNLFYSHESVCVCNSKCVCVWFIHRLGMWGVSCSSSRTVQFP